jgi:hypothetical protein
MPVSDGDRALPLDDFQLALEALSQKLAGRPRHSAANAFRTLRRAWKIAEIDPEIALFLAITAEEEAATALMVSLQSR